MTNTTLYRLLAVAVIVTFWLCFYGLVCAQDVKPAIPEKGILETIADIWKWDTDELKTYINKNSVSVGRVVFCSAPTIQGKRYITDGMAKRMVEKDLYGRKEAELLSSLNVYKIETLEAVTK